MGVMVERGKAPPKPGISNPGRGGNRIVEEEPATGNNRNEGKCLGTKLGALHLPNSTGLNIRWTPNGGQVVPDFPLYSNGTKPGTLQA